MRIGILCAPTYGGSGVVATELARYLGRRGHSVHVISTAMPFRLDANPAENVYFHEVQRMNYPVLPGDLTGIAIASKAVQVAADYDLDLLHAHYAIPHAISSWIAREAYSKRRLPIVTTLHGTDITLVGKAPSYFPLVKLAIAQSDAVTTVSPWLRSETIREFGITRSIEVIPNFVDEQKFARGRQVCRKSHYAPNGEKLVVHVSNFRPVKRIGDAVRAFQLLQQKIPSKLLLIGDGPERESIEILTRELRLMQHVYFLGKQEAIEQYLNCADLMFFPSEYESFGLAALEGMASECIVVSSNGGGLPDLIEHGVTGYTASVGDYTAMADCAVEILSDPERQKKMGRKAREVALERYHPDQIVPQYEALYEAAINGSWSV